MHKIGDKVLFKPVVSTYGMEFRSLVSEPKVGKVIYIHPEQRYMVLERDTGRFRYREAISLRGGIDEA